MKTKNIPSPQTLAWSLSAFQPAPFHPGLFRKHPLARAWKAPSAWNAPFPHPQSLAQASFSQESHPHQARGLVLQLLEHCAFAFLTLLPVCSYIFIHAIIWSCWKAPPSLCRTVSNEALDLLELGPTVFPLFHSVLPTKEDEFSFLCIPLLLEQVFPSSKPLQACRVVCWVLLDS